ncbi:hypothetical protein [Massilia sp. TWP1-3-3]|uniref:hypothetical protein n=1 Tax=Massilia sp. TWP1-3-3 TaxID=2804573 RepID=UPI003CF9F142
MHLPDLGLQFIYARLAWGIVLAALFVALWPRRFALSSRAVALLTLVMVALQAMPGAASPAYWLGLAFQWPSAMLVGLCVATLYLNGKPGSRVMPDKLAMLIAASGIVLYLDAFGLISIGFFYWGFGPNTAPMLGLLLAVGSAVALARGKLMPPAFALLVAMMGFSILRLPTGNIWDALIDPLLWGWALVSLARQGTRRVFPVAAAARSTPL